MDINKSFPITCSIVVAYVFSHSYSTEISRVVDEACLSASRALFNLKVAPGLRISSEVGNMYTASLYACFISLACS